MAKRRLRTVFFGSSDFSVPCLQRLSEEHDVLAVCSQPDRPAGRGLALQPTPISRLAREAGLTLLTPAKLDLTFSAQVAAFAPELLACASFGKILPRSVLELPSKAALNVHPSLLPRYRGATPIQSALRDGCATTGVTVFWMAQAMDAGDIALNKTLEIAADDNYETLEKKLARIGAEALLDCTQLLLEGILPRVPQNENEATYTKPLAKEDLQLRCVQTAQAVINQIRSLSPRPGAWIEYRGKRLKILSARITDAPPDDAAPGALITGGGRTLIVTDPGAIEATSVVLEGRAVMSGAQFAQMAEQRSSAP